MQRRLYVLCTETNKVQRYVTSEETMTVEQLKRALILEEEDIEKGDHFRELMLTDEEWGADFLRSLPALFTLGATTSNIGEGFDRLFCCLLTSGLHMANEASIIR